jgi:hypothetical protein
VEFFWSSQLFRPTTDERSLQAFEAQALQISNSLAVDCYFSYSHLPDDSHTFLGLSKGLTMAESTMKADYAASEVHDAIKDLLVLCES